MTGAPLCVRPVDPATWSDLATTFSDLTFEQSLAYARPAAARIGGTLRLLAIEHNGIPVAAAAVRLKRIPGLGCGIAWCPSGPLLRRVGEAAPEADGVVAVLNTLRRQICEEEGHVLRFRLPGTTLFGTGLDEASLVAQAGFLPWTGRAPYRSFALDLTLDADRLMQGLHGSWRRHLRFAQKAGLILDHGIDRPHQERFLALYQKLRTEKGFRVDIPPEFHFKISATAHHSDYELDMSIVTKDGIDIGGIVVGTSGPTATYLFGASPEEGRPFRIGYLMQWEAILRARDRGASYYDLGGVDFETNPDVSTFKERMGGRLIEAHPFEARPAGLAGTAILGLERLRARLKGRD